MSLIRIDKLFNFEKGILQSSKCVPGEYVFITASSEWKTHNEYTHDCEALIFAAAASGSLGRTHYINGKFVSSDLCFIITPKDPINFPIDLKFYHIIFNELKDEIVRNTKAGTSKEAIGLGSFGKFELPYFELKTQIEIKESFANSEEIKDLLSSELTYQLSLVKKLRQQFLQDAVQGKLVEQNPKDEPASELLKRIKAEKVKLIAEKKLKKEKELLPIKVEDIPFEIPDNWVWCKLGEILSFGPSNGFSPKESKLGIGIKCLTLTATTSGIFKEQFYKLVDEQISQNSYLWLESGDILIQRGNSIDYVGIAALYEGESHNFIFPDLMIKIRLPELINTRFIHQVLISPPTRKYYADKAFGAQKSMPKINQPVVLNTLIPLPPLSEQIRIVEKLQKLMQTCDELEGSIKQSASQNEKLLQQVLREALRKEVV